MNYTCAVHNEIITAMLKIRALDIIKQKYSIGY